MTLDELKIEISERIESEQDKLKEFNNCKSRKDKHYYIKRLTEQGNMALVCYGWEEASAVLLKYIRLKSNEEL